jgi:hypothetical protein
MKFSIIIPLLLGSIITFFKLSSNKISNTTQQKYLPVCIQLEAPYSDTLILQLFFKSAFKRHKIEMLSKNAAKEIIDQEIRRVAYDYYSTTKSPSNEEQQDYFASNSNYKINNVYVTFTTDSVTHLFKTFKWKYRATPFLIKRESQKRDWENINLDKIAHLGLNEMISSITDSIVLSGKLYKD